MQIDGNSIIPYDQTMQIIRHKYLTVILLSLALAILSLVSNIYFPQEMEGQWQLYSCIRKIFSKLFNAGVVWAALPFLAGWRSQSLVKAAISGAAIAELTLLLHYGVGYLIGVYDSSIFMANSFWFIAALVLCAPLGCALGSASYLALIFPVLCFGVLQTVIIPLEEAMLLKQFGTTYQSYQRTVRRWL